MSDSERRIAPRKACTVPVRFRVVKEEYVSVMAGSSAPEGGTRAVQGSPLQPTMRGEAVNLSERGIGFKSPLKMKVGQSLEMYLTLPGELTGRSPEEVRCQAKVVHVEKFQDLDGMTGVGAAVERFESLHRAQNWPN